MLQKSSPNVAVRKHSTTKPAQKVYITSSLRDHFLYWQLTVNCSKLSYLAYPRMSALLIYYIYSNMQQIIKRNNKPASYQLFDCL